MRPQQDFSRSFCSCYCPPLLLSSCLVPLGLLSHYLSTSLVVFLCFLFLLIVHKYSATAGSLFSSILVTCQNNASLLFLILSISVISCPSFFLVISFRILSLLDLPSILRSQLISATSIFLSSSFLKHQHSDPYIITGMTNVPYSFTLLVVVILFDLQVLFILPNIAEARPILRLMSLVHKPSKIVNQISSS